jgi:hypothetical protein
MKEVWERLRKEQTALKEVKEGFSKLMARGTTDIWRMKANMAEQLKGYERKIAAAATEDNQTREARERATKEQEETLSRERPHTGKGATPTFTGCQGCEAPGYPAPRRAMMGTGPTVLRSRDGVTLSAAVRAGASATETQTLRPFSDSRMTKLLSTGGPMCLCLQLYTENNIATWRQADVPNYGQSGVLMMPIKQTWNNDRVDTATREWQTMLVPRHQGPAEVVLRGVSREPEGRTKELILYTDQVTGKQSVRYRYQTGGQELSARNEGVTLFSHNTAEERSGAEPATAPEKDG